MEPSVVVIGGGPAGSSAGRLLASWGHRVLLLNSSPSLASGATRRGLVESLPPSSRKLLARVGVLDAVEHGGFYRSSGNTVWWAAREKRVEMFDRDAAGFQVFRPDFDRVLLDAASAAGVEVREGARVRGVHIGDRVVEVHYEHEGRRSQLSCAWIIDCSGRAGVLARRFRIPGAHMYALIGDWRSEHGWDVPDPTHTLVEAYDTGWAWSIPATPSMRQIGLMIDGPSPRQSGEDLTDAYRAEIRKASALASVVDGAALEDVWACDASTYSSSQYAGHGFVLAGDAGAFIDPLSSCGVKKALASAWMAAVVVNTSLVDSTREAPALEFFESWEREVCATHARRSREFAMEAAAKHPGRFWAERSSIHVGEAESAPDVAAALRAIKDAAALDFEMTPAARLRKSPVIRGREIVLEDAFTLRLDPARPAADGKPHRYINNVDLVALAELAVHHRHVPELFDAYCRTVAPAPLPNVLGGLSLLVASGVLRQRNTVPC